MKITDKSQVEEKIINLIDTAKEAEAQLAQLNQTEIDQIVRQMALAGLENHMNLAKLSVKDTAMGLYEDKIVKNIYAIENIYNDIKDKKTVGVIKEIPEENLIEVAEPVGIIAALVPMTNPTSTTMYKILISLKAGNPIIFSFHPKAQTCCVKAAKILEQAALNAGAPKGCIQWIDPPSIEAANSLMNHSDVSLVLATGGTKMVKAAYSSGTPAIGVGPGNVPAYLEESCDLKQAINDIVMSKTFDHGTVCASEQTLLVDQKIMEETKQLLTKYHAYILSPKESKKLEQVAIDPKTHAMNPATVGKSATDIAQMAEIEVPSNTSLLVAPLEGIGPNYPLSREKLSPILGLMQVKDYQEGIKQAIAVTEFEGLGHTAAIHSTDQQIIDQFSKQLQVGRLLINTPTTFGAIGDLYNHLTPSLTLGCGTYGGNSTTDNVSVEHLYNIKRITDRKRERKWIKIPSEIYFEPNSLFQLRNLEGNKAVIITDQVMKDLGYVKKVTKHLKEAGIDYKIFSGVEPDPSVKTVLTGTEFVKNFEADLIIALGGGSPMDAAKGIWLFYENPELDFEDLKLRFADIKKRTYQFPKLGQQAKLVAIPTTSGSGSEVTSFTVITDKENNIKYPLVSYELTPDIAIIDSELTMTLPPQVTAHTGLDVLTHAIEGYVSILASDYTDPLALKAIKLVFDYLPQAYQKGQHNRLAREKMHNASCIAGIVFTNAFLGINHSLAHILGGRFGIPHGLANAILLPHVIRYNSKMPTKIAHYPNYSYPQANKKYKEIANWLGLDTTGDEIESLISAIKGLMKELNVPLNLAEAGIKEEEFKAELEDMATFAYSDQSTVANPRRPLISELIKIYKQAYQGLD
ncbi:bifunctional acetaldehyde-CoA/alcohol dehydrogenase [Natroniella sulfidigena]|uniref:bifunctional acetaldehyde-CoA/alcohol dehydrogenase n=1 Tax=Natroniella sulfidigena TaxID=723921 RepID=UPI00200B725D|nr:bifunctional acetaldehyde-CoA/alcohol dehydrogenase [Natroniella sulfidigena]